MGIRIRIRMKMTRTSTVPVWPSEITLTALFGSPFNKQPREKMKYDRRRRPVR